MKLCPIVVLFSAKPQKILRHPRHDVAMNLNIDVSLGCLQLAVALFEIFFFFPIHPRGKKTHGKNSIAHNTTSKHRKTVRMLQGNKRTKHTPGDVENRGLMPVVPDRSIFSATTTALRIWVQTEIITLCSLLRRCFL